MSDPDAASTASEKALKLFDRIDILINNAGINYDVMFTYTTKHIHFLEVRLYRFLAVWYHFGLILTMVYPLHVCTYLTFAAFELQILQVNAYMHVRAKFRNIHMIIRSLKGGN